MPPAPQRKTRTSAPPATRSSAASAVSCSGRSWGRWASGSPEWPRRKEPRLAGAGFDIGALIGQLIGGGAGGAVLTLIVGLIRNMMSK